MCPPRWVQVIGLSAALVAFSSISAAGAPKPSRPEPSNNASPVNSSGKDAKPGHGSQDSCNHSGSGQNNGSAHHGDDKDSKDDHDSVHPPAHHSDGKDSKGDRESAHPQPNHGGNKNPKAGHEPPHPPALPTPERFVVICHKPRDGGGKTMVVQASQVPAHLAHGDSLGACTGKSPGHTPHDGILPPLVVDNDGDGVRDGIDLCPNTLLGQPVDANGCSCSQLDTDIDGVNNCVDRCPNTRAGEQADAAGCSCSQRDADQDSVNDCRDRCTGTPPGTAVDAAGCACSQRDADADGVSDCLDLCAATPGTEAADSKGCSCSQRDADGDGVDDCKDQCANTPSTEVADSDGCSCSQLDDDGDGVNDCTDQCANTPLTEVADSSGCSCAQRDADADGVNDCLDLCGATPGSEFADANGCSCSQLDSDSDGVSNCADQCAQTPAGEIVDADGCSISIFTTDAGPDRTAVAGDLVTVSATVEIVQGPYAANDLLYIWQELSNTAADVVTLGPTLTVDTMGVTGDMVFRLTVRSPDGSASVSDVVVITVLPARLVALVAGRYHNAALTENDLLRLWGSNRDGQLGDGSIDGDVNSVDTGESFTLLSKTDGTAWVFGQSVLADSPAALQVGTLNDVAEVSAILDGGMMLRSNGAVWGFARADNRFCELAGSTAIGAPGIAGPRPIPGLPNNIVHIASAGYQTIALGADGRAWVWGGQRFGCVPFVVLDHVVQIAAGENNLCLFVRDDGTAWAMGYNFYGQLGNGNTVSNYRTPTQTVGLTNVVAVAAGEHHSLFLRADGTLFVAGRNHDCELGLGTGFGTFTSTPRQVSLSNVRMIAGGFAHSVAVVGDDEVYVWGINNIAQLSGNTQTPLGSPVCTPTPVELGGD